MEFLDNMEPNAFFVPEKFLIEFAKWHVQKALKEASEKSFVDMKEGLEYYFEDYVEGVNKNSILNAYPLDNVR